MRVRVECYSGCRRDERPLRFFLDDRAYEVIGVLDRWYGPGEEWFKVLANDGGTYILRQGEEGWSLAAYTDPGPGSAPGRGEP